MKTLITRERSLVIFPEEFLEYLFIEDYLNLQKGGDTITFRRVDSDGNFHLESVNPTTVPVKEEKTEEPVKNSKVQIR